MRRWRTTLLTMMLVAAWGCASDDRIDVGSTFDPLTRFPAAATWIWDERANRLPDDERIGFLDLDAIIREVSAEEFARRGYTEVESGASHYLLSYELGVVTWTSQTSATATGSISLTLRERESHRRVWLGFVRAPVDVSLDREQRVARIGSELRKLLETFPPNQPQ